MTRSNIASITIAAAALTATAYLALIANDIAATETAAPSTILPVAVETVAHTDHYEVQRSHAGRVVSRRTSELGFERGGRIEEILVSEGDQVEAGSPLARLATRELRATHREFTARARELDARLALARITTGRRRQLHAADSLAPQLLDEARFAEDALAAQLESARAAIQNVDVQLANSEIRAPYAGSITLRSEDEGTVVAAGKTVLRLIEDGALEVEIGLPPAAAARLEPGSRHLLDVEGQRHPALLHAILPTIEPDTRTLRAIFHFDEGTIAPELSPGALARLHLEDSITESGFWLPLAALSEGHRGLWNAYVAVADESTASDGLRRIAPRALEVIHAVEDRAYVRGTLEDGDQVVIIGVHRLVPGQRVRVQAAAPIVSSAS